VPDLPKKLKHDAIVEALLEIRFSSTAIPEVFFGRLADHGAWCYFSQRRLPTAEIPEMIRNADANLRFLPTMELVEKDGNRSVKLGPHVISYHNTAPYLGWANFEPALDDMVDALCARDAVSIQRLGLRYVNALTLAEHRIEGLADLNLSAQVAGQALPKPFVMQYQREPDPGITCIVRVISPNYVEGKLPPGTSGGPANMPAA
jgi:uncharacterized protein (TIGR04255 family)